MDYKIVNIEEKKVAGQRIRTRNSDPNMTRLIGELWQVFFANGIYDSIKSKLNDKSIGLYTNYDTDMNGEYDVMVCCEILDPIDKLTRVETDIIPAGKYAKFIVQGDMQKAVAEFWTNLWSMDLDRKYSCDFEEYQSGSDMNHPEIHIYISLN